MKRLIVCLFALALVACTATKGITITEERLADMKKNKATVQTVIAEFGPPTSSQLLPSGERMLAYGQSAVHFDPKAAIPIVGLFVNESGYSSSFVSMTFGTDGALQSYMTQNTSHGGGGTTFSTGVK